MLQAIEAEIGTDGRVTLLEPIRPAHPVRAVVTLLAPVEAMPPEAFTAATLLELLDSPPFKNGPPGDPDAMEQIIAANRNAWEEQRLTQIYLDSCLIIYLVEQHPDFAPQVRAALWTNDDRLAKVVPGFGVNLRGLADF